MVIGKGLQGKVPDSERVALCNDGLYTRPEIRWR